MNNGENYKANLELGEKQGKWIEQFKENLTNNNIIYYNYEINSSDKEVGYL